MEPILPSAMVIAKLIPTNLLWVYECSACRRRFPDAKPPEGKTEAETRLLGRIHLQREFARHLCTRRGWPQDLL